MNEANEPIDMDFQSTLQVEVIYDRGGVARSLTFGFVEEEMADRFAELAAISLDVEAVKLYRSTYLGQVSRHRRSDG